MIVELSEDKKFLVIKECTQEEYEQVVASYTKMADGYRFNPLYKKSKAIFVLYLHKCKTLKDISS